MDLQSLFFNLLMQSLMGRNVNSPMGYGSANTSSLQQFLEAAVLLSIFQKGQADHGLSPSHDWFGGSWDNAIRKSGESLAAFDTNNNGKVTKTEAVNAMVADGSKQAKAQALVNVTDVNRDGEISCFEDVALSRTQDLNGDGFISNEEYAKFFQNLEDDKDAVAGRVKENFETNVFTINGTNMTLKDYRQSIIDGQ